MTLATKHVTITTIFKFMPSNNSHVTLCTHTHSYSTPGTNRAAYFRWNFSRTLNQMAQIAFIWTLESASSHHALYSSTQCMPSHTLLYWSVPGSVTPLLHTLHWLPLEKGRIDFKLASLCFKSLNSSGPQELPELLHLYTPSRQLRSSDDTRLFRIPSFRTRS